MSNLVEVGKTNELENGAMKEVLTEGCEILHSSRFFLPSCDSLAILLALTWL